MFGLTALMNTGWQLVQSTLSSIEGVLFSPPPDTSTTRRPIGLDQLIQAKGYWVNRQREVFAELNRARPLTPGFLQSALDELLDQLGGRLGSPAVMLLELEQLHEKITDSALIDILRDAKASIQASMIKDPRVAYANLMADIQLLCEDTSMQFINSIEGRTWLEAYRPFFSDAVFEQALLKIVEYANIQQGELYCHLEARGLSSEELAARMSESQTQIDQFRAWVDRLTDHRRQMIEPLAREMLSKSGSGKVRVKKDQSVDVQEKRRSTSLNHWFRDSVLRLLKMPGALVSQYPRIFSLFLLVSEASAHAFSRHRFTPETSEIDISKEIQIRHLKQMKQRELGNIFIPHNITQGFHARKLNSNEQCSSGFQPVTSWAVGINLEDDGKSSQLNSVAVDADGNIFAAGHASSGSDSSLLISSLTGNGSLRWAKQINKDALWDEIYDITISNAGNLIIVGTTYYYPRSIEMLLLSMGLDGSLQWANSIGGGYLTRDKGNAVAVTEHGQIIAVGFSESDSYNWDTSDFLITNFSPNGDMNWVFVAGSTSYDAALDVAIQDNKIYVLGRTSGFEQNTLLMCLSMDGSLLSANLYGGGFSSGNAIINFFNSQLLMLGAHSEVVLLDANGAINSAKRLDALSNYGLEFYSACLDQFGGFASVGASYRSITVSRFNQTFDLVWSKEYDSFNGGAPGNIVIGQDDNIIFPGRTYQLHGAMPSGLLAVMRPNGLIENIASNFMISEKPTTGVIDVTEAMSQVPAEIMARNASSEIVALNLTGLSLDEYFAPKTILPISLSPSLELSQDIDDPRLTQEFSYRLEPELFSLGASGARIAVDTSNFHWLNYDQTTSRLTGTPVSNDDVGAHALPLRAWISPTVGFAESELILCVRDYVQPVQSMRFVSETSMNLGQIAVDSEDNRYVADVGWNSLLVKINPMGGLLWAQSFIFGLTEIRVTPDGNILLLADDYIFEKDFDIILASVSPTGGANWATAIGGDGYDYPIDMTADSQDNIYIIGHIGDMSYGHQESIVASYAGNGTTRWVQSIASSSGQLSAIGLTSTNNLIILGEESTNFFLAKFSINGDLIWSNSTYAPYYYKPNLLTCGPMGKIFISDYNQGIMQYNSDGVFQWAKEISGLMNIKDIYARSEGQVVVVGSVQRYNNGTSEAAVIQLNDNGSFEWGASFSGDNDDYALSVTADTENKLLVVGDTESFQSIHSDGLLLSLDPSGAFLDVDPSFQNNLNSRIALIDLPAEESFPHVISRNSSFTIGERPYELEGYTVDVMTDSLHPAFFRQLPNPIVDLVFGQQFEYDFTEFLFSSVEVLDVYQPGKSHMPTWIQHGFNKISGRPKGDVRGGFPMTAILAQHGKIQTMNFILNVMNTSPQFVGEREFESSISRFVLPLAERFEDAEGDTIGPFAISAFNGTQAAPIASIDARTGRFFGTPLSGDQGEYHFNITAADPYGGLGWGIITLTLTNLPPWLGRSFDNPSPVTIGVGQFTYSFPSDAFVDPDGDEILYDAIAPDFLQFNPFSRLLTGTPQENDAGLHEVVFRAFDSYGGETREAITIDVNLPPVVAKHIGILSTSPVGQPYEFSLPYDWFSDPDGDALAYQMLRSAEYQKPSWLGFDQVSNTLFGTPDTNLHRPESVQFEVSDGRGGISYHTLQFEVPNSAPQVGDGLDDQSNAVNRVQSLLVPFDAFIDLDQDTLSYDVRPSGSSMIRQGIASVASNVLTFVSHSGDQGLYSFELSARDGYGGEASLTFELFVPNRVPTLRYQIPKPANAVAGSALIHDIPVDNFGDEDQDRLQYFAELKGGGSLPNWLHFNSIRRIFSGTPSGNDRGLYQIRVMAEDVVGAIAEGYFNLSVVNSVPQLIRPMRQQTVSQLESDFSFRIEEFVDPDGDPVTYSVTSGNNDPLPAWITFDPSLREFTVFPQHAPSSGNYPIQVTAIDSEGQAAIESFDLTVQSPPDQPGEGSMWAQYVWTAVACASGLAIVSATMMWRADRIRMTNARLRVMASRYRQASSLAKTDDEMNDVMAALIKQIKSLEPGTETGLIHQTQRYSEAVTRFAVAHAKPGLIQRLNIDEVIIEGCKMLYSRLVNKRLSESERFNREAHSLIYSLTVLMDAVTLSIARQGNLVSESIERKLVGRIDEVKGLVESLLLGTELRGLGLCGKQKASLRRVHTVYGLNALREATVYLPDTSTLLGLLKESLLHVISPAKLLSDFRFIVSNVPSKWYMPILSAKLQMQALIQADNEDDQLYALRSMQYALTQAMRETFMGVRFKPDWRLCYGVLSLYIEILKHEELSVKAKFQILTGKMPSGEQLIGLESFASHTNWLQKARARWIREAALDGLGQLANIPELWADDQLKSVLTPYRQNRASRAVSIYAVPGIGSERRLSRVRRLSLPRQEAKPTGSSQFTIANPLAARTSATKPRQAVPVQTVRRSIGAASTPSSSTP